MSALLLSIRRSCCCFLSLALLLLCTLTLNTLALPLILAGLLSRLDKGLVLLISLGLDVCMDEKYLSGTSLQGHVLKDHSPLLPSFRYLGASWQGTRQAIHLALHKQHPQPAAQDIHGPSPASSSTSCAFAVTSSSIVCFRVAQLSRLALATLMAAALRFKAS